MYFYIWASDQGRNVLLGPYDTREEANRAAWQQLNCYFEIVELPTRDRGRATQIMKAQKLERTQDLSQSLDRVNHHG